MRASDKGRIRYGRGMWLAVGASACALAVGACGSGSGGGAPSSAGGAGGSSGATKGALNISPQGPLTTFDPWSGGSGLNGSMLYLGAVYDTLLNLGPQGQIAGGLASSYKRVNMHEIKLTLRQGIKFQDGSAFNAAAVKANFDYAQSVKTPAECNVDVAGVKTDVTGRYAVTLKLTKPNPDLLLNLATCAGFMVSPQALKNPSKLTTTPDGTGPYTYDQAGSTQNQTWVFHKKASNWNSSQYPFKTINFTHYASVTASDNAARSGQVNFIQVLPSTDKASGLKLYNTTPTNFRGLVLADIGGKLSKPLANVKVRQAMNYAVDRAAILKSVDSGDGVVNGSSAPAAKGVAGWEPDLDKIYPYDVAKAKQLMAQAGYPHGFTLAVLDSPTDANGAMMQAIAGFEQAIGIKMNITQDTATFIPDMLSGKAPAFFGQWQLSGALYQVLYQLAGPSGFWNPFRNSNPQFNALLAKLARTRSSKASPLFHALDLAYAKQAWWVAPVTVPNTEGYNPSQVKINVTNGNPVPMLYQIQGA